MTDGPLHLELPYYILIANAIFSRMACEWHTFHSDLFVFKNFAEFDDASL